MNKYVTGKDSQSFYASFLKYCQVEMKKVGYLLRFVFFSDLFRESVKTENDYFYNSNNFRLSISDLEIEAHRIERDYNFSFKQAYFPDIIQVSKYQNGRKIHIPEKEFSNLDHLVGKFLFLEKTILHNDIDAVFCDQSPEVEMEFARAICFKHKRVFLKQNSSFLGRNIIFQQFGFGKERLVEAVYDPDYTYEKAIAFVKDFVRNKRLPYERVRKHEVKNTLLRRVKNKVDNKNKVLFPYYAMRYVIRILKKMFFKFYLIIEEKIKKNFESKYDATLPYLFFGLHLNTESTVGLRALPYMNQTSLIESISRILPYGYYLYVREHPHWRRTFPVGYLAPLTKLPNIRLISANVSIHEVIKNSKGILTYNATTGIEALIHEKPVLSFAPNVYYGHHPAVDYCSDLFELGSHIVKLINTKVKKEDTYNYICKLFRISNNIPLMADTFLSDNDAKLKAIKFTRHLVTAIEICLADKKVLKDSKVMGNHI